MRPAGENRQPDRGGFTLIEIIIAVAIVAILAGAITPLAFRELMSAREDATLTELRGLNAGLMEFYEDTGRFPNEAEGLAALVNDPGVTGWSGPYLGGDRGNPVTEVSTDGFNQAYIYDLNPSTTPAGTADVVVASSGIDQQFSAGDLNQTWHVDSPDDDLISVISSGPVNRDKLKVCQDELTAIAAAARQYFAERADFPSSAGDLTDGYMDPGLGGGNFTDPWHSAYVLAEVVNAGSQPSFLARSYGPDRQDDGGNDDDMTLNVSSIPPGRDTTLWKLGIAQTVLNNSAGLVLTGSWANDMAALGLDAAFAADGWGQDFEINGTSRTVFSVGPDGDAMDLFDNLPAGVGPDLGGGGGGGGTNNGGGTDDGGGTDGNGGGNGFGGGGNGNGNGN